MLHYMYYNSIIVNIYYIIQYSLYPSLCPAVRHTRSEHAIFWITIIQTKCPGHAHSNPEPYFRVLMVLIVEGRNATSEEKSKIPAQRNDKMSMFGKSWNKRNNQLDGNYWVLRIPLPSIPYLAKANNYLNNLTLVMLGEKYGSMLKISTWGQ